MVLYMNMQYVAFINVALPKNKKNNRLCQWLIHSRIHLNHSLLNQ